MQEGLRKTGDTEVLKKIVSPDCKLSVRRQCELLGLNRSSVYYNPVEESAEDLDLMLKMDKEYHQHPTKGVLGMVDFIKKFGILIGPKKVRRLLRKSWFLYLTAIIDVYSRYIVGWNLSNTLSAECTLNVLKQAIKDCGNPGIINSDQGSQFTCPLWTEYLEEQGITISMDGRGVGTPKWRTASL